MFEYEVTLSNKGREMKSRVFAHSTATSYKQAEHLYPGTRALNARQL